MQRRRCRIIGLILAAALFLTGIYLDTAAEDVFFLCDSMGETFLCPVSVGTDINKLKICGRETWGESSDMEQQTIEAYPVLSLPHAGRISLSQRKYFRHSESVQSLCRTLDVLVTDYLHQSDGKKRN